MANRIIYTRPDGGVSVVVPSPNFKGTMDELQAKLESRGDLVAADTPEVVDEVEVPSDRTFRDAWKRGEQGKKLGVDMVKAKDVSHNRRRAKREEVFKPLDAQASIPTKFEEAESKRKVVRAKDAQVQTDIDNATDVEQLKAVVEGYNTWDVSQETVEKTVIDPETFFDRFTEAEQQAIVGATGNDTQVKIWYDRLMMQKTVELDSPRLDNALDLLVSKSLLTAQRKTEVLQRETI